MKEKYIKINNLKVSEELLNFVNNELLKETEITPQNFWKGFDKTAHELSPRNDQLINIRETIQKKIDEWHIKNKGNHNKIDDYKNSIWLKLCLVVFDCLDRILEYPRFTCN